MNDLNKVQSNISPTKVDRIGNKVYLRDNIIESVIEDNTFYTYDEFFVITNRSVEYVEENFDWYWSNLEKYIYTGNSWIVLDNDSMNQFYHEEIVSEPTGNMVEESYTYLDENGVEQTGTRLVKEYHDVIYIKENNRGQFSTYDEALKIANLDGFNRFMGYARNAELWQWHDAYVAWFNRDKPVQGKDGNWVGGLTPEIYESQIAPVEPSLDEYNSILSINERKWRDNELLWYDKYQNSSCWNMLNCTDRESLYRYYVDLLEYPQSINFPNSDRPTRPILECSKEKTIEDRWVDSIQHELNARRLSPLVIHNALTGNSGEEVTETLLISPTQETLGHMVGYVTESFVNGLVDVTWNTEDGRNVKLTVQNLKPVFKVCEKYVGELYKAKEILTSNIGSELLKKDSSWPSKNIYL